MENIYGKFAINKSLLYICPTNCKKVLASSLVRNYKRTTTTMKSQQKTNTKRHRGRPALSPGEKGNYENVLLNPLNLRKMDIFRRNPIVREEDKLQVIRNILAVEETANYYWKVVYTTAFQELKAETKDSKYSLRNATTDANVPYHNIKKIFIGRGNNEMSY